MRTVLIAVVCLILGGVAGAFVVSRALIEPFDVLAWPYANRPVATTRPLVATIYPSGVGVSLPAGTPLVLRHAAMGQQHFAVLLVGEPDVVYPTTDTGVTGRVSLSLGEARE
jgi:hypothetical protein